MGPVAAHIARALAGGVIGSAAGSLVTMLALLPRQMLEGRLIEKDAATGIILFLLGLIFTLPSALLLAAPIIWPFRGWVSLHPCRAALIYGAIGGVAGWIIGFLLGSSSMDPVGAIGATFGAATGVSFIAMLRLASARPEPSPPLDSIFD